MPAESSEEFKRRRYVYLAASLMMLARAGELPWSLITVAGLVFFLAWVLSGAFERDLRLQRAAAGLVRAFKEMQRGVGGRELLVEPHRKYAAAAKAAGKHLRQPHIEIIEEVWGREYPTALRRLAKWLRWHPWYRIL